MKESLRRPILFAVIVITGSLLVFFDIPLTLLIPVILIVGFIILMILGAVTVKEIKDSLESLKPANVKKIGILKKLDGMKFFEKSTPVKKSVSQPVKAETKQPVKGPGRQSGIGLHITSFVSSIKSLGSLLRARSKSGKKVAEINSQLDRTVSEKVEKSPAPVSTRNAGTPAPFPPGGAGTAGMDTGKDQDPFLSLSDDEFDAGLLDSLDDLDSPLSAPGTTDSPHPLPDTSSPDTHEPDIPFPSLDIDGEAGNILSENAEGLDEFSGLAGGDTLESDFGDLDNLTLDDVDIEEDAEERPSPSVPAPVQEAAPAEPGKDTVKTEWIKSDAPKNAGQSEDQISTHADMAVFSGGGGSDADLLSSLASDVKHVKVEKNLSLLRELKDFKAPATEIDTELSEVYTRMDAVKNTQKKVKSPQEGIK